MQRVNLVDSLTRTILAASLFSLVLASGCKEALDGPEPSIQPAMLGSSLPVDPGIICRMQHPDKGTPLVLRGDGFSPIPYDIPNDPKTALPDVTLMQAYALDGTVNSGQELLYDGMPDGNNADLLTWQSQGQMTFYVKDSLVFADGQSAMLEPGLYDLTVKNANGAETPVTKALAVTDRPHAESVSPGIVCLAEEAKTITLTGQSILRIGANEAVVVVGDMTFPVTRMAGCTTIAHPGLDAEICAEVDILLGQNSLAAGFPEVTIQNPETAACHSVPEEDGVNLRIVSAPTITSIEPSAICVLNSDPVALNITGTDFLKIDGETFSVTVNGTTVTPTNLTGCTPLETQGQTVEACTGFTISVTPSTLATGPVSIEIVNPSTANCGVSTSTLLEVAGPPVITDVIPPRVCTDEALTFTVTGSNLSGLATVTVGSVTADSVTANADNTVLTVDFDAGLPPGTWDLTVDNGIGCKATQANAVEVDPLPIVFFVDPPVTYNGIAVEATIYTTGLSELASQVELIDSNGVVQATITNLSSPTRFNRIQATIPDGLPADTYEVRVTSAIGCASKINGQLQIAETLSLTLASIDPAFVSPSEPTATTILLDGGSTDSFTPVPRVYLNPTAGAGTVPARAMQAVEFKSASSLTGVVPGQMSPGDYDLVVVNPDGAVGLLPSAVTVTVSEPPKVTALVPGSLDANSSGQAMEIRGANLTTDPTNWAADFQCVLFADGTPTTAPTATLNSGTATSLSATVDSTGVAAGTVCVMTLRNADGASYQYSALSLRNSSQNLNAWATGATAMNEARRSLALWPGRPTETSRFLYAVAGDDGVVAGGGAITDVGIAPKTTVESSPVDVFGTLGTWDYQRNDLSNVIGLTGTQPRTFFGSAKIGRFLYVIGGYDGTTAVDTVLRAKILDPLDAPEIVDLDATLDPGVPGIGEGIWSYRVAALFPPDDPSNPSGESLPGEVFNIQLPPGAPNVILTLTWAAVPNASGYRLYRTPTAGSTVDAAELLAEVAAGVTSYSDDGTKSTDNSITPMPTGSLGTWHQVPLAGGSLGEMATLGTAREGLAAVAVQSTTQANTWYLYAAGGRDGAGADLATIEMAEVTINSDASQSMSAWSPASAALGTARAELSTYLVTRAESSAVPVGESYVFFGNGRTSTGTDTSFEAAFVDPDTGALLRPTNTQTTPMTAGLNAVNGPGGGYVGSGAQAANGYLFLFGGKGGAAAGPDSASLVTAATTTNPINVSNSWNAPGGGSVDAGRIFPGSAKESAFFFIAGGLFNDGSVVSTIRQTIQ